MCPQHVLHSTSLLSHTFWQKLFSFHLLYIAQRGVILGSLHSFIYFEWWANQIGLLQKKKKTKNWTWEAPHLIN
jgi:hypothetical protein